MAWLPRFNLDTSVLDPHTEWTRRKLQILLGTGAAVVLAIVAGCVWSMVSLLTGGSLGDDPAGDPADDTSGGTSERSAQDRLAGLPLPRAPLEAAQPGTLSSGQTGTLRIPAATAVGPAAVGTGFPRTPEGALAQLAEIDRSALSSASVRVAQEVITVWSAPGGPTARTWSGVKAVATLLEAAGMSSDGSGRISIGVEPRMGFIKGTVGENFVIPCIDFVVTATTTTGEPRQVAAADCQRMVWRQDSSGGRWVIGPGDEPVQPPSLWPGSQASFDAGYQYLEVSR